MVSKKGLLFYNYLTLVRRKILLYFRAYSLFLPKVSIFFRTSPFCVFIVHKNCKILTRGKSCFFTANANIMYIYHELCQRTHYTLMLKNQCNIQKANSSELVKNRTINFDYIFMRVHICTTYLHLNHHISSDNYQYRLLVQ